MLILENIHQNLILLTTGVPQGSILGPLLFNIYMNDIHHCTNFFKFILYADDISLFNPSSQNQTSQTFNTELDKIFCWLSANKLILIANKTKFMIFHNPRKKNQSPLLK